MSQPPQVPPQQPYQPPPWQQPSPAPVIPTPNKKRFGWPTVIITALVALGVGGIAGGGTRRGPNRSGIFLTR